MCSCIREDHRGGAKGRGGRYKAGAVLGFPERQYEAAENGEDFPRVLSQVSGGPFSGSGVERDLVDPDGHVDGVVGGFQV